MSTVEPIPFSRPWIDDGDIDRVADVLRSGWWTSGSVVRDFEDLFAAYVGTRHAIALNSCTAALHVALAALGVARGDLVITSTYTFAATAEVAMYLGATPLLLDVDPATLNISTQQVRSLCSALAAPEPKRAVRAAVRAGELPVGVLRSMTSRSSIRTVKAIIPVHFAGQACDMAEMVATASEYGVPIVEDAAHAVESTYCGSKVGAMGVVGAFSFYATKNLSTGEGGMATTDDDALAARMRSLSLHGISRDAWNRYTASGSWRYDILEPGYKYNMTDITAALGIGQLGRIDALRARREEIAGYYSEALRGIHGLEVPRLVVDGLHAWHLYVARVGYSDGGSVRDELIERLKQRGIGTSVHFIPLHLHSYYRDRFGFTAGDYPVAEREFARVLSLPLYPSLADDETERVVSAVREVMEELDP
jgi:dTDP-4-amino-4,6-dideoxygalactose transaminase